MMVAAMLEQYAAGGHSIGSDSGAMLLRFFGLLSQLYGRVHGGRKSQ
jgi:hypothetical protein